MDHDPGLDVPGTLEINARIMILDRIILSSTVEEGNGWFLVHLSFANPSSGETPV